MIGSQQLPLFHGDFTMRAVRFVAIFVLLVAIKTIVLLACR